MNKFAIFAMGLAILGGAAYAHEGVKNEAVKARMDLMQGVKEATGILGGMAKGAIAFDEAKADAAKEALIKHAAAIPAAFEANEMDPKSTALPAIWDNWSDFVSKAEAMGVAASDMDVSDQAWLAQGMGALGGTCSACHKAYRVKK